jgi:hypothetical protein
MVKFLKFTCPFCGWPCRAEWLKGVGKGKMGKKRKGRGKKRKEKNG